MGEINEAVMPYLSKKVAGGAYIRSTDYTNVFISENKRAFERVVYLKAIRRVSGYLNLPIGDKEFSTLAMVVTWNWQNKRVDGGGLEAIVGWSGYTRGWKRWINWGFRSCLELGLLEYRPVQGGKRVCITDKGKGVLRALDEMSDKVIREMDEKINRT